MCDLNTRYGYYTVVGQPFNKEFGTIDRQRSRQYVKVQCDCGSTKEVRVDGLKSGHVVSCGCYNRKISSEQKPRLTHGLRYHPLNGVWKSMKYRCYNKKCKQYKNYGGRGISICKEWKNNFKTFYDWAISNGYEENLEIDRTYVNGNYEPGNCRFVTPEINANNKRNNIKYIYKDELLTLPQIAKRVAIGFPTLYRRINELNFSLEDAISIKRYDRSMIKSTKQKILENI